MAVGEDKRPAAASGDNAFVDAADLRSDEAPLLSKGVKSQLLRGEPAFPVPAAFKAPPSEEALNDMATLASLTVRTAALPPGSAG